MMDTVSPQRNAWYKEGVGRKSVLLTAQDCGPN